MGDGAGEAFAWPHLPSSPFHPSHSSSAPAPHDPNHHHSTSSSSSSSSSSGRTVTRVACRHPFFLRGRGDLLSRVVRKTNTVLMAEVDAETAADV
jgi:hypothetical protein